MGRVSSLEKTLMLGKMEDRKRKRVGKDVSGIENSIDRPR